MRTSALSPPEYNFSNFLLDVGFLVDVSFFLVTMILHFHLCRKGLRHVQAARQIFGTSRFPRLVQVTHDEAWTWQYGGETALRRWQLEKLIEKAK